MCGMGCEGVGGVTAGNRSGSNFFGGAGTFSHPISFNLSSGSRRIANPLVGELPG